MPPPSEPSEPTPEATAPAAPVPPEATQPAAPVPPEATQPAASVPPAAPTADPTFAPVARPPRTPWLNPAKRGAAVAIALVAAVVLLGLGLLGGWALADGSGHGTHRQSGWTLYAPPRYHDYRPASRADNGGRGGFGGLGNPGGQRHTSRVPQASPAPTSGPTH